MGIIFEILFQLLFECFGQAFLEISIDALSKSNKPIERMTASSFLLALAAVFCGSLSLLWFPTHFFHNVGMRVIGLLLIPLLNGLFMSMIGKRMLAKGREPGRMEHFVPAFTFSLVFSLIRFFRAI